MSKDWQDKLLEILLADTSDLRELANIAGADPKVFYKSARITREDLKSVDARGVVLPSGLGDFEYPEESTSRLILKINPLIHQLIKRGNRNALSAHVSVLLRVFLDEYFPNELKARASSSKLEGELLKIVLSDFKIEGLPAKHFIFRRTVSYHVDEEIKGRLLRAAMVAGRTQSELARYAIYFCLLFDPVRNIRNYSTAFKEDAIIAELIEASQKRDNLKIFLQRKKSQSINPTELRSLFEGIRVTIRSKEAEG